MAAILAAAVLAAAAAPAALQDGPAPVTASLMAPVLRTADCGKAQAYYQAALAMTPMMSRDLGTIHETLLAFPGEPARPGIMLICNVSVTAPAPRGVGASRLIVAVGDLDAVVARLDAAKLPHPAVHAPQAGVKVMTITDPEGNELELVQRPPRR
jgi:hypothetical protein